MNNAIRTFRGLVLLLLLAVAGTMASYAGAPNAPKDLKVEDKGGNMPHGVLLSWEMDDNTQPFDGFNIYMASEITQTPSDFTLRDVLEMPSDSLGNFPMDEFYHFVYGLDKGDYSFYVTAYNQDGESAASNILSVSIRGNDWGDRIYITNPYMENVIIQKGTLWQYDVDAETESDEVTIKYSLEEAPAGMTIDENTGLIEWTPSVGGSVQFRVIAYEENNAYNYADADCYLYVKSCTERTVVTGLVKNKEGKLIKQGFASLMEVVYDSLLLSNPYFTSEIHNGEFSIEADAGEFKLMIGAPGYKMMSTAELINQESVVLSCGDSLYFEVELEKENWHKDRIYFSTYPTDEDLKLGVNSTWTFDVDAECDDDQIAIRYKLEEAPEGMTINELTGELSWLPTESGMYYFAVIAYDANGTENMAVMSFTLNVFTCATPITVSGTVVYDNPDGASELEPVEFGYAVLMSADVLDSANVGHKPYYSNYAEITNGEYSLQADAGSYYLWFTSYGAFEEEFWENAYDFDNATIIELECGNSYTFDASVAKYTMPEYKTISGRVTDEETGAGIGQALVAFEGSNDKNQKIHLIVLTDSDGYYVAELDDNFEYIAQASTTCWRPGGNHQDTLNLYIPEYYNDVTNISEAEVLTLEEDLENIDFALAKSFDFENSLSGSVVDGDNNVVSPAWVVAFLVDTDKDNQDHINWGFTTEADQNGAFSFESILPGNYVLLAFPEDIDLAPGYFVENDFASIDWKEATKVAVSEDGTIAGKTIKLQKMEDVKGIGIIRGKIAKKGKKGIGMVEGDAEPISGALVYTIDEAGKIVEFKRTNTLGDFAIENLPNGRYNIVVDKVGFDGLSMWAEIDDNNKELDVNTMTLNESTTSIEDKIFAELSLYPNPAVTTLTVNLGTLNSDAKVQLVDVNGVSLYKGTVKSNENHKIDVNALTSGMYYLKVTIADELTVLPVAITK